MIFLTCLPVPSDRGRAPSRCSTMATDSPFVFMASRPHRLTCSRNSLRNGRYRLPWDELTGVSGRMLVCVLPHNRHGGPKHELAAQMRLEG